MPQNNKEFVLVYGDGFVDFIAEDLSNTSFQTFLGGATVNVAAGLSRIGTPVSFITNTGDDQTSEFVRQELVNEGVDLSYALFQPEKRVSGVYVHLTENNDRIFQEYVDETPDLQVMKDDLQEEAFAKASVFHMCSGTMFHPTALVTTKRAVELALANGTLVSMDANIRPLRWTSEAYCRETISSFFSVVHLLKLTDEELFFLTETTTIEEGIQALEKYEIPLLMITVGADGAYAVKDGICHHVSVEPVEAVDTTGAGDAFMAGVLNQVHVKGMPTTTEELIACIRFGNTLGALAATKAGALTAMPTLHDIENLL